MKKSYCSIHDQEEERYICVHPICLKKADNKLCCVQCFTTSHRKKKLDQHQFISVSELQKKADRNYQSLIQHFNDLIEKNAAVQTDIERKLQELLNSIVTWQSNQKKMFNDVADYSNSVLTYNISKADQLFKNPSLDTYIYFYIIDLQKIEISNQEITKQSLRNLQYQLQDIEAKRDILVTQTTYFKKENFLKFKQMDYLIEINNLNDFEFQKCSKHLSKMKMLCTHPKCLQNPQNNLQCLNCIQEEHQEHYIQKYVQPIAIIQKEQTEKISLIQELKNKFCQDILGSMDKNFTKINQNQEIYYKNFENLKEKGIFLELQQLSLVQNSKNSTYIFDNIDLDLLQITKDQIQKEYMSLYYNFETKFSTIFEEKVNDDLQFCTELDQNSKRFFKYVINLEQELQICQQKLENQQQPIQNKITMTNENPVDEEIQIQKQIKAENYFQEIKFSIEKLDRKLQDIQVKEEVQKGIQKLDLLQTNLNNLNVTINDVKKNTQISNTKLTCLNSNQNEFDAQFKELKNNASNQSIKLQNISSSINAIDVEIKNVKTTTTNQNSKLLNLGQNVNTLDLAIKDIKQINSNQDTQFQKLEQNIKALEVVIQDLRLNTINQNSKLQSLNQSISNFSETTNSIQNTKFQTLNSDINSLDEVIQDINTMTIKQNNKLSDLDSNINNLNLEIKKVEMSIYKKTQLQYLIGFFGFIFLALIITKKMHQA
ncbi:unnamed protein product [Paramecium sonneborni]|uniref:t-SNARE coiled-coil homology domain-containing protein n=1 Tax=Paramecium sonneborni TaxID=65129 RepID=A0A8S1RE55_9CILI|nr:unnamed protein product [Paramecium sonneborni]